MTVDFMINSDVTNGIMHVYNDTYICANTPKSCSIHLHGCKINYISIQMANCLITNSMLLKQFCR